ncbi:MAG TPA: hypothetical protein DIT67_11365 [Octadecabacter sp.]|nr:hypothetical protein [Octadecabacter sp.]
MPLGCLSDVSTYGFTAEHWRRWHQTLKNRIFLENYFLSGDLEVQLEAFADNYWPYKEAGNLVFASHIIGLTKDKGHFTWLSTTKTQTSSQP